MNIVLIGFGAIAKYIVDHREALGCTISHIVVPEHSAAHLQAQFGGQFSFITQWSDDLGKIDLVVECAGHGGLLAHAPAVLSSGHNLLTISIGALADQNLYQTLQNAAEKGGGSLMLASGAIGALDALRAGQMGQLKNVCYKGRKPPMGWMGSPAEEKLDLPHLHDCAQTHFVGNAREAALQYPKNANVAAAIALSGLGFEATQVELIADPSIEQNVHEVLAEGDFGQLKFVIEGNPLPTNPRTSALAAMSVIASIKQAGSFIKF